MISAWERYVTLDFPCWRVITVASRPRMSIESPRASTSRSVSRATVAARIAKTMMMRSTTHNGPRNTSVEGIPPKGDARRIVTKPKRTIKPTTTPTMRGTRFPGARRGGAQYGWGPYGGAVGGTAGAAGGLHGAGERPAER